MIKRLLLLVCFLFLSDSDSLLAQDDNLWWSSYRLRMTASESLEFDLRPTFRLNENFSAYQNSSIDFAARKKISKHWRAGLLIRPWLLKNNDWRLFIWPAMIYSHSWNRLKFGTRFMYHQALDIKERNDSDFFRVRPVLSQKLNDKWSCYIAFEAWLLFDKVNELSRFRYDVGLTHKFNDKWSLAAQYWFQDEVGVWKNRSDVNIFVTTLTYKLKLKSKKDPGTSKDL